MSRAKVNDLKEELFLSTYFPRCCDSVREKAIGMLRCNVWVILANLIMKGAIKRHAKIEELTDGGFYDEFYVLDLEYIMKYNIRIGALNPRVYLEGNYYDVKYIVVERPTSCGALFGVEVIRVSITLDTSEKIFTCSIPINITNMEGTNMKIQAINIGDLDTPSLWQLSQDLIYMALDLVEYFPT